ncbi:DUF6456 domain-containing protein [Devosia sp.]|uniref:DUF6456 domain-containing protein n=1 Tax=Devosia sp. TaxID=1871048 RepID=UPI0032646549
MPRADARSIRFVRALLPDGQADLNQNGQFVVNQPDRVARLPEATVRALFSQGVLVGGGKVCRAAATAPDWLRRQLARDDGFGAQHRILATGADAVERNLDESPLSRLAAVGRDGSPAFLLPHQIEAGERLRRLVERAQLTPRTTMSYDVNRMARSKSGPGGGLEIGDSALDARRKLNDIARALPSDCSGVLFDICGLLKGLQVVESERGWPRRSAKLVLRIGLEQLAAHFGLSAQATGSAGHGVHAWLAQRPTRFECAQTLTTGAGLMPAPGARVVKPGMRQKLLSIQYLRGIAALLVLASHALLYPLAIPNADFHRLGWMGVILFFVISGFIMVTVVGEGKFDAIKFLQRRAVRIVPMYWGATILAAVLALVAPSIFKTTVFDGGQLILSVLFVPFYNPVSQEIRPLYKLGWTLNYEVFFYVCFALLAFVGTVSRVVWLTAAFTLLTVLGLIFAPKIAFAEFYTSYMPLAFCAGAWLGLATLRGGIAALPKPVVLVFAVLGVAGLVDGFAWQHGVLEDGWSFAGFALFASALVLLGIRFEMHLPKVALLERMGDASYSIYLVHIYAVAAIAGIGFKLLDPANLIANIAVVALAIVGGVIGGLIVYEIVEKPLLNLLRHKKRPELAQVTPAHAN